MMRLATLGALCALVLACNRPEPAATPVAPPTPAPAASAPASNVSPIADAAPVSLAAPAVTAKPDAPQTDDDDHAHEAPHGGSLIEFGEEFAHLELLLNGDTGRLTVYALDGEAEKPVRLTQPSIAMVVTVPDVLSPIDVRLAAVENALTGEKSGDSSQFVAIVPELKGRTAFKGTVTALTIRGRSFERVRFDFPATEH